MSRNQPINASSTGATSTAFTAPGAGSPLVNPAGGRVVRAPRTDYTLEFRASAVQLVERDGKRAADVARELCVNIKTLSNWLSAARSGTLRDVDTHRLSPVSELQAENSRLRRALSQVSEERDILKKATAYFARIAK